MTYNAQFAPGETKIAENYIKNNDYYTTLSSTMARIAEL